MAPTSKHVTFRLPEGESSITHADEDRDHRDGDDESCEERALLLIALSLPEQRRHFTVQKGCLPWYQATYAVEAPAIE